MSIKTQKILRFIPIINIVTVIFWQRLRSKKCVKLSNNLEFVFKSLLAFICIGLVYAASTHFVKNEVFDTIASYVFTYFVFFTISWNAVAAQEKILSEENEQ